MKFFVSTLVFLLTQNSFAKTCVLSILDNQSKDSIYFSHRVSAVFKNYVDADLFEMPSLEQIKLCFSSGLYSEIIWLSHGTPVNHDPTAEYASPVYLNKKK